MRSKKKKLNDADLGAISGGWCNFSDIQRDAYLPREIGGISRGQSPSGALTRAHDGGLYFCQGEHWDYHAPTTPPRDDEPSAHQDAMASNGYSDTAFTDGSGDSPSEPVNTGPAVDDSDTQNI